MSTALSSLTGALGSVIGYLGSEVAEPLLLERVLWPQRFCNDLTVSILVRQSLLMTMGGPLHAAALATLDQFRDNGLYLGQRRGNYLGTAFYPDSKVSYKIVPNLSLESQSKKARNGFWIHVIHCIDALQRYSLLSSDEEQQEESGRHRASQSVNVLTLTQDTESKQPIISKQPATSKQPAMSNIVSVSEYRLTWKSFLIMFCSEAVAIVAALIAGIKLGIWWLFIYMLLPLVFKFLAALLSVRREGLQPIKQSQGADNVTLFNIDYQNHGFTIIKGPMSTVQHFFRHYGHPLRDRTTVFGDRTREVLSMLIIYAFVLYFPTGLILSLWMTPEAQYLWLTYQVYAIIVMHVVRVLGWQRCGSTDERVARHLCQGSTVRLYSSDEDTAVLASIKTIGVKSMKAGESLVQDIIKDNNVPLNASK